MTCVLAGSTGSARSAASLFLADEPAFVAAFAPGRPLVTGAFAAGWDAAVSVVAGGGGGTFTCACLGWPQAARNRIESSRSRVIGLQIVGAKTMVGAARAKRGASTSMQSR